MMGETLMWLGVLGVIATYMHQPKPKEPEKVVVVSAQREVDPTRWRHDGSQPTDYYVRELQKSLN
jgi:hypothetical protein